MPLRFGRALTVFAVVLAVLLSALAGVGPSASLAAPAAGPQNHDMGVSGAVAARALNALEARNLKSAPRQTTNVHFILNWLPNVEFAGLWVAEQFGWFRQAGIHMTFTPWAPAVHPETDVVSHPGVTFGLQSGAAIVIARAQGVPIKALYTDTQRSVFGLTVLANSGIKSLRDLRGKRIGYQSHEFYVPATMLSCVGLRQTDWRPVQVSFDIVQLTAKHVDAYLTFIMNEPVALQLNGVKVFTFPAYKYCFHFYDDVLFTTDSLINKNPAIVTKVVRLVAQGFRWAHLHPDYAARLTVRTHFPASAAGTDIFNRPMKANTNLIQQIDELRAFGPFSRDSNGAFTGLMNRATWQDSTNILYRYGQIRSKPNVISLYTNRFNPYNPNR